MNLFETPEYLEIFKRHFCEEKNIVEGIWEKHEDKLILVGMKLVLGKEEVTDYAPMNLITLPEEYKKIQLDYVREDSGTYKYFTRQKQVFRRVVFSKQEVSPYIILPKTWEEYLESLERKHRKELKRKIKRLEAEKSFYECNEATVKTDFEEFVRLHRLSDPAKNQFMSEAMKAFFWDIMTKPIAGWQSSLCFLKIEGKTAAGIMSFESQEEYWLYNSGYDLEFSYYSVGLLLKAHSIKKAIEAGKKKYDFLRGNERYKYELGAKDLQLYKIEIEL